MIISYLLLYRPKILQLNGLCLGDFPNREEALQTADELIAHSVAEYGHKYAAISYGNPLTDKFFYVQGKGRTKTWYKGEEKTLSKDSNPKNTKALTDMGGFGELGNLQPEKTESEELQKLKGTADMGRSWDLKGRSWDIIGSPRPEGSARAWVPPLVSYTGDPTHL